MKKKLAILVSMMMAATMFAACGDDSSSSAAPAADDTSSVAETTTAPEESTPEETTAEETSAADSATDESGATDESSTTGESGEPAAVEYNGSANTDGEMPADFQSPNFVIDDEGNVENFFNLKHFDKYKDTGCSVTIKYTFEKEMDMTTLEEKYYDYYLLSVGYANGWTPIYPSAPEGTPYITGIPEELDARVKKGGDLKEDFTGAYFMQSDGYIVFCQDADGNWSSDSVTFNITPEGVQSIYDNIATNDDGSQWGGLIFQTHGINVSSVTLGDPVEAPAAE